VSSASKHLTDVQPARPVARIPITDIHPSVDGGKFVAKGFVGEIMPFSAVVFREGHDSCGAEIALTSPTGKTTRLRMRQGAPGSDRWHNEILLTEQGIYSFEIESFADDFQTWHHNAEIKIKAGIDVQLMIAEGLALFERGLKAAETGSAIESGNHSESAKKHLQVLADAFSAGKSSPEELLAMASDKSVHATLWHNPIKSLIGSSEKYFIEVERKLAGVGAWYEFFVRSEGAKLDKSGNLVSGTFKTATKRLAAVAEMGFDVLYLPPVHPIGVSFRKGPNNSLNAGPKDVGSPWAIGNSAGGHDTINPELGTQKDFEAFVKDANKLGLEIAMDLALQAAPDHPWVKAHPEWFTTRADGSIAYAENPPKKYQDIYPINFDNDPAGIEAEVLRVVHHWISSGVKIFRVDNPHTKPVVFWQWLIAKVRETNPEVIFLAEAFTRPAMMHQLGKVGFQQSYTYFAWRNTKAELESYLIELAYSSAEFFRPNLWPSTPDILTEYLQKGGKAGSKIRAAIAAMGAPLWGMYAGYELLETVPRPGVEEHIDSEKYEIKIRDWAGAEKDGTSIASFIGRLNQIRKSHTALSQLRNIEFHRTDDESVLAFSKWLPAQHSTDGIDDRIIVIANLDPHAARETTVHLRMDALGFAWNAKFVVKDLISGDTFNFSEHNFVRLDPSVEPVHILQVVKIHD
jgi:starch synthase (maltosyl-transferring)